MPSVNSRSIPNVWPSSTFTTPSLPTFSIASAITSPISSSPAELAPARAPGRVAAAALPGTPPRALRWPSAARLAHLARGALDDAPQGDRVGGRGDVLQTAMDDGL